MKNALNWFEIPTIDIERAASFYGALFGIDIPVSEDIQGYQMAVFPVEGGVGGALLKGEGYVPSTEGTLVWLNGGDDLSDILARVEPAGGKVLMPKTHIGAPGFCATFLDTEGNRVGLHSRG
jgi:predicted enzyme related to lactoylglutathione lyase